MSGGPSTHGDERRDGEVLLPSILGAGRYVIRREIGRGGFGTVFTARDTQYECDVAIKLLRSTDAGDLYRFKGEFRGVADISHPNLVRLYELGVDDRTWFVVMELVDGVDLLRWVWGDRAETTVVPRTAPRGSLVMDTREVRHVDRERLRAAFAQVARGLVAIHDAGKLHRDLKPSNVLVTSDGQVKLLDFGLVLSTSEKPSLFSGHGIGTPGYMAPEQRLDGAITPAADWYAFGVMLHEALTGGVPRDTPSPLLPADELGALCRSLLERDPSKRPDGAPVLAVLTPSAESAAMEIARAPSPNRGIVGRDAELAALDDAWSATAHAALALRLVGASGVGKSTLVDAWLDRLPVPGPVVLRGRCLEHENVPFKAIDGVIDALAAHLAAIVDPQLPSLAAAIRMFPVLARPLQRVEDDEDTGDPVARRERALACVRSVLAHIATKHGLVVYIDDVQWGDPEGLRALADLVDPRTPGMLLVLAQRHDVEMSRAIEQCFADVSLPRRTLELVALAEKDALSLARSRVGEALAARVAGEAAGNPFLIHQLADYHGAGSPAAGPIEIADLVARKIERIGRAGRQIVEVAALAASPLAERVLVAAAELEGTEARIALQAAEKDHLVAGARVDGSPMVTTLHDRVREEVVRQIAPGRVQNLHRRIAKALVTHGFDAPEVLLHHHLGAEDHEAATDAAVRAADHAESVLAFERAAEHYSTILRLGRRSDQESRLHEKRGGALANAGRAAEAAEALQESVRTFGPARTEDELRALRSLNRRSGELWLRSGHVDAGKALLAKCLGQIGFSMPRSSSSALFTSVRRRVWFFLRGFKFTARQDTDIPPNELERLDLLWGATTSLAMLDYVVADSIGLRHLLEALRVGERKRVLRSLSFEVGLEAVIGGAFLEKHSAKLIKRMEALGSEIDEPYLRAWISMTRGVVAWCEASFAESWSYCNEARTIFRRDTRGTTWELAVNDVYGLSSLTYVGDIPTLARIVPDAHRSARERGDRYATANLAFFESFLDVVADNPAHAREIIERASEPFPKSKYLSIHYGLAYAIVQAHLYEGNVQAAWELVEADFPAWKKGGMLAARTAKTEVRYLRARAALAMLSASPGHALAAKRLAEDLGHLERERTAFGKAAVLAIRAARAHLANARQEARAHLAAAESAFDAAGLTLHALAARRHVERLDGAEPTTQLPHVASSERMSHLLLAGFRP